DQQIESVVSMLVFMNRFKISLGTNGPFKVILDKLSTTNLSWMSSEKIPVISQQRPFSTWVKAHPSSSSAQIFACIDAAFPLIKRGSWTVKKLIAIGRN